MRRLIIIFVLLMAGCTKSSANAGLHLEDAVPDALRSKIRLADSIYLTAIKVIGEEYEDRVSRELRRPTTGQPLPVGGMHMSGRTDRKKYPEQFLVLRYDSPNASGGTILEESFPIYEGVLRFNNSHIPANVVILSIDQSSISQRYLVASLAAIVLLICVHQYRKPRRPQINPAEQGGAPNDR